MTSSRAVRRLPLVLAALVAAPLVLGACGSSADTTTPTTDGTSATSAPPATSASSGPSGTTTGTSAGTTTTTEDDTTTTSRKRTTTTEAGGPTTTTDAPTTPTVTDSAFVEYCELYAAFDQQFKDADDDDPAVFVQIKVAFQQLTAVAPAAIKADVSTLNDYIQSITAVDQFIQAPAAVMEASDRINEVTEEKCGLS